MGKRLFSFSFAFVCLFSSQVHAALIGPRVYQAALAAGAPDAALQQASDYLEAHAAQFPNKKYLTLVDFTRHSGDKRLFMLDLVNETVDVLFVAHGRNSDRDYDGYATQFSNTPESKMSSLGFFRVAERYQGQHGLSVRLDGLEKRNDKARARAIVIHGADYVSSSRDKMGRSWGCPAVEMKWMKTVAARLEGGSLLYAYIEDINERVSNDFKLD